MADMKSFLPSLPDLIKEFFAELPVEAIKRIGVSSTNKSAPNDSSSNVDEKSDVDILTRMRMADEAAFSELVYNNLDQFEIMKIEFLLANLPPLTGSDFISTFLKRKNQETFRKCVLMMSNLSQEETIEITTRFKEHGQNKVRKDVTKKTVPITDNRLHFLQKTAQRIKWSDDGAKQKKSVKTVIAGLESMNMIISRKQIDSYKRQLEKLKNEAPKKVDEFTNWLDNGSKSMNRWTIRILVSLLILTAVAVSIWFHGGGGFWS